MMLRPAAVAAGLARQVAPTAAAATAPAAAEREEALRPVDRAAAQLVDPSAARPVDPAVLLGRAAVVGPAVRVGAVRADREEPAEPRGQGARVVPAKAARPDRRERQAKEVQRERLSIPEPPRTPDRPIPVFHHSPVVTRGRVVVHRFPC